MLRSTAPLLALALALAACTPASGDTDGEDTDTAAATDSDGETDTDTDGETDGDVCPAEDESLTVSFSVDYGAWTVIDEGDGNGGGASLDVAATCTVASFIPFAGELDVILDCTDLGGSEATIAIAAVAPADLHVTLPVGETVLLDAGWHGVGHHVSGGEWFAIHDAAREHLLFAGISYDSYSAAAANFDPLSVDTVDGVCPSPCPDNLCDPNDSAPERLTFRFTHSEGAEVVITDAGRGLLSGGARDYDIVLHRARQYYCLNCSSDYKLLIGSAPQG
ncbi:MAG: hypothetical protein R3A79_29725 [Nannocystaceae bacterium]